MKLAQLASVWPKLGWLWLALTLAFAVYHSGGSLWRGRWPSQIICSEAPEAAFICAAFQLSLSCMIPLRHFDGASILAWRPAAFAGLVLAGATLTFAVGNEHVLQWLLQLFVS